MRWVTTVVLLVVLAALGIYIALEKDSLTTDATLKTGGKRVFASFKPSDVTRVEVKNEKGSFTFEKASELAWKMTSPRTGEADRGAIDSILTSLEFLEPARSFDAADAAFALDSPRASVIVEAGGKKRSVAIGASDAAQGGVYAKATDGDGTARILRIEKGLFEALDKDAAQFRNRKLSALSSWQVERFSIESSAGRVAAKKQGGNWLFEEPIVARGDSEKIRELQNAVLALQAAEFVVDSPTSEQLATYGLDAPRFTVTLEGAPKEFSGADSASAAATRPIETIKIGAEAPNDTVYAMKLVGDAGAGVVTVSDAILTALKADFDSLRDHRLFGRPGEELTRIEIAPKDGTKTVLVGEEEKREGAGSDAFAAAPEIKWKIESPVASPADGDKVATFARKFKELRADSFAPRDKDLAAYGLDEPSLSVSALLKTGSETFSLHVGGATEDGASRYVKTGSEDHVYVVPNAELEPLQGAWHAFRDPKLLDFFAADTRSVVVSRGGASHEYVQKGTDSTKEWYRKADGGADAIDEKVDRTEVTSFLSKISALRAESFASDDVAKAAEFGIGPDATTVTVTYSETVEAKPGEAGEEGKEEKAEKKVDVTKSIRVAAKAGDDGSFAAIVDGVDLIGKIRVDVDSAAGTFLAKTGAAPPPKPADAEPGKDAPPPADEPGSPEEPKKDEGGAAKPDGAADPPRGGV